MFYEVRILDSKGKLKKVVTSKLLSRRHWILYPDYHKPSSPKAKNAFNAYGKAKRAFDPDRFGDY